MNEMQINDFCEINNIKEKFSSFFNVLIENNSCEDLNISDKNISIDLEKIHSGIIRNQYFLFKTKVINKKKELGHYSLIFEQNGKLIDEFFVIY
jgi:hypothetical protein